MMGLVPFKSPFIPSSDVISGLGGLLLFNIEGESLGMVHPKKLRYVEVYLIVLSLSNGFMAIPNKAISVNDCKAPFIFIMYGSKFLDWLDCEV